MALWRRSQSTTTTFDPAAARVRASEKVVVVLPSPGSEEVTTITLTFSPTLENRIAARSFAETFREAGERLGHQIVRRLDLAGVLRVLHRRAEQRHRAQVGNLQTTFDLVFREEAGHQDLGQDDRRDRPAPTDRTKPSSRFIEGLG